MMPEHAESEEQVSSSPAAGVQTSGPRSPAVGTNLGTIITGDGAQVTQMAAMPFPPPEKVEPAARVVGLPRPATPVFVGRHAAYQHLKEALSASDEVVVTQAVYGLGGVGKSELALQYAHHARTEYRLVWWITAESPHQIEAGLAELVRHLVPDAAAWAGTTEDAAVWAVGWLRAHPGWLLVLDNVTDPAHVSGLLGRLEGGQVLVTSRRDVRWPGTTTTLRLDLLDPDAAAELITTITAHTEPADRQTALEIAQELGFLPLALDQAAAYIRQTRITLDGYLERLRRHPARYYTKAAAGDKAQSTIARLWDITLDTLTEQAPGAVELAAIVAHYAPDDIPRALLVGGDAEAAEEIDEALGVLASHSMIDLTGEVVAMHRLTQAAVLSLLRDMDDDNAYGAARQAALAWLQEFTPDDPDFNVEEWPVWRSLVVHVEAIATHYATDDQSEQLGQVLNQTALYLQTQGEYQRAHTLLTTAVAITEAVLDPDDPDIAVRLGNLASVHRALGRPAEALPLEQRALAITEAALGPDHPTVAILLGNLALTHRDLGRPAEALPLEQRALAITEAVSAPDHLAVAISLGNLASSYSVLGRPAEALPLEQRALAITEAVLGSDHPTVATSLGNLAGTYSVLGRAGEALPLFERALAITEAVLGSDHPTVATSLGSLAGTYITLGRAEEALPMYERALAITVAALGSDHPAVAIRLGALAGTHRALGRATEALPLEQRALAITEAVLGPDHPTVATGLNSLASTHRALGRVEEALPMYERALAITEAALGPDHPTVAISLSNLAGAYGDLGQAAEALPMYERALAITVAALGPDHPNVAISLGNLAGAYNDLGRAEEALPLFERAFAITVAALGPDHPNIALRLSNLAAIYAALGRADEALPLEQRALAITEAALGPDHPDIVISLGNLATIYSDLGMAADSIAAITRAEQCALRTLGAQHPETRSLQQYADHLNDLYGVPDDE